jgi:hypothetical protein
MGSSAQAWETQNLTKKSVRGKYDQYRLSVFSGLYPIAQAHQECYRRRKSKNRVKMVRCPMPVRSLGAPPPSRSSRSRS